MQQPDQFLPRIYDHSLAEEVGAWVLERALDDLQELLRDGQTLPISINVFPRQFVAQEFAPQLQRLLDQHVTVEPEYVELEIVETAALNDLEGARRVMQTCQDIGVRCALDDFGTGYSSLSHLKYLPVSTLKIDRSFISDLLLNPDDLAIVEGTLNLAVAFGHQVIAEGVETIEQGVRLIELGCTFGQGYAIARPMPLEDLRVWLKTWEVPREWSQAAARTALPARTMH